MKLLFLLSTNLVFPLEIKSSQPIHKKITPFALYTIASSALLITLASLAYYYKIYLPKAKLIQHVNQLDAELWGLFDAFHKLNMSAIEKDRARPSRWEPYLSRELVEARLVAFDNLVKHDKTPFETDMMYYHKCFSSDPQKPNPKGSTRQVYFNSLFTLHLSREKPESLKN